MTTAPLNMAIQEEIGKGKDINGRFLVIGDLFSGPCQAKGPKDLTKGVELKGTDLPHEEKRKLVGTDRESCSPG